MEMEWAQKGQAECAKNGLSREGPSRMGENGSQSIQKKEEKIDFFENFQIKFPFVTENSLGP